MLRLVLLLKYRHWIDFSLLNYGKLNKDVEFKAFTYRYRLLYLQKNSKQEINVMKIVFTHVTCKYFSSNGNLNLILLYMKMKNGNDFFFTWFFTFIYKLRVNVWMGAMLLYGKANSIYQNHTNDSGYKEYRL